MKKLIVPLAILGMLALICAAAVWDCVRLESDGRRRLALADQEMQKHEQRLVKLLAGSATISPEVRSAVITYQNAATTPIDKSRPASKISTYDGDAAQRARHDAFESVISGFRKTMGADIDPTNPLNRAFMDGVAGAINRRAVAEQQYDEELAAYQSFLNSRRGRLARWFSSDDHAD